MLLAAVDVSSLLEILLVGGFALLMLMFAGGAFLAFFQDAEFRGMVLSLVFIAAIVYGIVLLFRWNVLEW